MRRRIPRPMFLLVLLGAALLALPTVTSMAGEGAPTAGSEAQTVTTTLTTSVSEAYPDLPQEMKGLVAQGMTMAEAAKVLSPPPPIGTKIDLGDGEYAIRIDDRLPEGLTVDPILVPGGPPQGVPSDYLPPPPHLAKGEWMLYGELRAAGEEFQIVQGQDRYLHIRR